MKKVVSSFLGGLFSLLQKGGQWWIGRYRAADRKGKAKWGCGSLFAVFFACSVLSIPFSPTSTPTPTRTSVLSQQIPESNVADVGEDSEEVIGTVQPLGLAASENVEETTVPPTDTVEPTAAPTNTPSPTNTPRPTSTPRPTNTPEPEPLVEISVSSANLRSGPGTNYDSVGSLVSGDVVEVIARTNDGSWYNVELANGSFAWIEAGVAAPVVANSLANISVAATIPAPPVVVEAPPPTSPPAEPTDVPASAPTEPAPEPTAVPAPTDPPPPSAAQVVIINVNKRDEYVDIQNTGGTDQDLGGWTLISEKGNQVCGLGGVLPAGATLRIWAMSEDAGQGGFNCGFGSPIWNNSSSDPAVLVDSNGAVVSRY